MGTRGETKEGREGVERLQSVAMGSEETFGSRVRGLDEPSSS